MTPSFHRFSFFTSLFYSLLLHLSLVVHLYFLLVLRYTCLCSLFYPLTLSSIHSAHPGWRDHRSHHRGGAGAAGAHRGHLLPDEVSRGTPRLQPQCQVSARPVAGGALPVGFVPGTGAEARAHPWHGHLRGQAGIAAAP